MKNASHQDSLATARAPTFSRLAGALFVLAVLRKITQQHYRFNDLFLTTLATFLLQLLPQTKAPGISVTWPQKGYITKTVLVHWDLYEPEKTRHKAMRLQQLVVKLLNSQGFFSSIHHRAMKTTSRRRAQAAISTGALPELLLKPFFVILRLDALSQKFLLGISQLITSGPSASRIEKAKGDTGFQEIPRVQVRGHYLSALTCILKLKKKH